MSSYLTAMSLPYIFVGGTADPVFSGRYERLRTQDRASASFYHSLWPNGAPNTIHFTVAPQGRRVGSEMAHFHISVTFARSSGAESNVSIYFNHRGAAGLQRQINLDHVQSEIATKFDVFYSSATVRESIDRMAVEFFNKAARPAVDVGSVSDGADSRYVGDADLSLLFRE